MSTANILKTVIENRTLKKIVLSKPADKSVLKTAGSLFVGKDGIYMQLETFLRDGKVLHRNVKAEFAPNEIESLFENYNQADIITDNGNCQILKSSKGKIHIVNNIKESVSTELKTHDKTKNYFLDGSEPFLRELGLNQNRAKFRQINRFLELVDDIELPQTLNVYDLCCGKSYLTFALYHYLYNIKNKNVTMFGVDLKQDVIKYCTSVAENLNFEHLKFVYGDIENYTFPVPPDMVISLHACDTATDIVLAAGIKNGAKVILSTPCCQHELMSAIESEELKFITQYGILKQKLCDAATDALRCKLLEIAGYDATAIEFIDPDDTPKNILLRAVKRDKPIDREKLVEEYNKACELLGAEIYLGKLIH